MDLYKFLHSTKWFSLGTLLLDLFFLKMHQITWYNISIHHVDAKYSSHESK